MQNAEQLKLELFVGACHAVQQQLLLLGNVSQRRFYCTACGGELT